MEKTTELKATPLTPALIKEVRALVLEGYTAPKIRAKLKINAAQWDTWMTKNKDNFAVTYLTAEHERFIGKSKKKLDLILSIDSDDEKILKLQKDVAQFCLERLSKDYWALRDAPNSGNVFNIALVLDKLEGKSPTQVTPIQEDDDNE